VTLYTALWKLLLAPRYIDHKFIALTVIITHQNIRNEEENKNTTSGA